MFRSPGRSRGGRHLRPVGRVELPEVAARKRKKNPFLMAVGLLGLIFACLLVILPGLVRVFHFPPQMSPG